MAKRHSFASKAQWKWAFATHKTWSRRWAHSSGPYKTLPRRRGIRKKL
jgi:hypothetical protein